MPEPIIKAAIDITTTLPLTQYMSYFNTPTPVPGPTVEAFRDVSSYTFNFIGLFTQAAPFSAVTVQLVSGSVIKYYFGLRIAMTALLFVVAFVATRLGLDVPTTPIVIAGQRVGYRVNVQKLPKLPRIPKFAVALAIITGMSISLIAVAYAANVTLTNPNFDTDVSGWNYNEHCSPFEWTSDGYSGGGGAAYSGGDQCIITQTTNLPYTEIYTLSFFVKCSITEQLPFGFDYDHESYCNTSADSWVQCVYDNGVMLSAGTHFIYAITFPEENCTYDSFAISYPDQPTPTPTSTPTDTSTPTATSTPTETPTPGPTATGTPAPSSHTIELSSGERFSIDYRFSFGEISSIVVLILLVVITALRWIYDFIVVRRDT